MKNQRDQLKGSFRQGLWQWCTCKHHRKQLQFSCFEKAKKTTAIRLLSRLRQIWQSVFTAFWSGAACGTSTKYGAACGTITKYYRNFRFKLSLFTFFQKIKIKSFSC